jgi:hypothetical protein
MPRAWHFGFFWQQRDLLREKAASARLKVSFCGIKAMVLRVEFAIG